VDARQRPGAGVGGHAGTVSACVPYAVSACVP
jgi:hypothetical protein